MDYLFRSLDVCIARTLSRVVPLSSWYTPQLRGKRIESHIAATIGGVIWEELPKETRKFLNSSSRLGDNGIDIVKVVSDSIVELIQVKWVEKFGANETRALLCLHGGLVRSSHDFRPIFYIREDTVISRDLPRREDFEIRRLPTNFSFSMLPSSTSSYTPEIIAKLDGLQNDILEKIVEHLRTSDECRVSLPPGCGKSYIIKKMRSVFSDSSFVIACPRVEIVKELSKILEDFDPREIHSGKRDDEVSSTLIVCNPSMANIERSFDFCIQDEAHINNSALESFPANKKIKLSATLRDPDFFVSYSHALDLGVIAEPYIDFIVFNTLPTIENIGETLSRSQRYRKILLNFQTQEEAKTFHDFYLHEYGPEIGIYTSDYRFDLERFRDGAVRILCHVSCLELGVNILDIDTVAFVHPWKSNQRMRQLFGRAERLSPEKWDGEKHRYRIVFFVGGNQEEIDQQRSSINSILEGDFSEDIEVLDRFSSSVDVFFENDIDPSKADFIEKQVYTRFGRVDEIRVLRREFDFFVRYLRTKNIRTDVDMRSLNPKPYPDPSDYFRKLNIPLFWDVLYSRDIDRYPTTVEEYRQRRKDFLDSHPKIREWVCNVRKRTGRYPWRELHERMKDEIFDIPISVNTEWLI
jgi:hypothetical protein